MINNSTIISQPVFLIGAECSGMTLLGLMLDHHPQITFQREFEFVINYFQDDQYPALNDYYQHLAIDRQFQNSNFTINRNLNYPELVNSFLVQKLANTGKNLVGATVHKNFKRLLQIWPEAKFIHLVRDGRDVARSYKKKNWAGNVWTGCDRWLAVEQLWLQLKPTIKRDRYLEIRYEDLITQPEATLTDLCNFMGTNYSPAMLTYPQVTNYALPNPKLLSQWQHQLSRQEIRLIETKIGSLLLKYDYELSDFPPLILNSAMKQTLKLHSKLMLIRGRINIYGLLLVFSNLWSRLFHRRQWQRDIQLEFNNLDTARWK